MSRTAAAHIIAWIVLLAVASLWDGYRIGNLQERVAELEQAIATREAMIATQIAELEEER